MTRSAALPFALAASFGVGASLCLTGCPEDETAAEPAEESAVAEAYEAAVEGLSLRVETAPYAFEVRGSDGARVLRSRGEGDGDGYGALGVATGTVEWGTFGSPGWFTFTPRLDPFEDAWIAVSVEAGADRVDITLAPAGAVDAEGAVADPAAPTLTVRHRLSSPATLRVEAEASGVVPRAFAAAFETPADEAFLGFGERFNRADQRGVDVFNWAEEGGIGTGEGEVAGPENPFPSGEAMSYYPVPYFVSTAGYAFWLDSTWRSEFNLATARDDAWRAWHIGPELAFEVYLPWPEDPRPWPYHVIDAFTARTGRPMLPPAWTLGPRRRIGRGASQLGVPEVQAMRDLDLAITGVDDALHFLPEGSHVGIEEELAAWTADASALGYAVCGYYNPYLSVEEDSPLLPLVDEGLANGYFLTDAAGKPSEAWLISGKLVTILTVDFTDEAATAWYQSMLDWAVDLGYRGWMYDFGEYVSPDVLTASGLTGEEFHNLFPVLYQRAAFEAMESGPLAGQWLAFARSGFTGASQYAPMVWSGDPAASFEDSDGLPSMVRAGVNLGISGVPHWGGDINGFHCLMDGADAADGELLARWIQQGSMSPNMQDQDACSGAPEGADVKASIFTSAEGQEAWRTYARLHTRLFPYLYSLSHEAHATGAPIMRHPYLEHPDRPDLAAVDDAYYFGPAILVAPVLERGATARPVDLPEGLWLDWHDGVVLEGGGTATLDAPLSKLPLLLRDGYLVTLLDPSIDTLMEEDSAEVVGPGDVADVYDVVGFLSSSAAEAAATLYDGGTLRATFRGGDPVPDLPAAADEAELSHCDGCFRLDDFGDGLSRLRVSAPDGAVAAPGLDLWSDVGRRVRWDLYLFGASD